MSAHLGTAAHAITTRVVRSVEELEDIRLAWDGFADSVTSDPDYYLTLIESHPRVLRPYVILIEREGAPVGLVVGRIEDRELVSRIGYRRVFAPSVRSLTISNGGLLGAAAGDAAGLVVTELQAALDRREAEVVFAPHLRVDSAVCEIAGGGSSSLVRRQSSQPERHWQLVPASFDELLASKSSRSRGRIRRYRKRFLEAYGDQLAIRVFASPNEIDSVFEHAGVVAGKTYQYGLGVAFTDDPLQRRLVELAMRLGWFRGYVLYIDDHPSAFWFGTAYRGTFQTGPTGYDPAYSERNIGTFLLMRMIEDMCEDPEIERIDYGFGDAEYKHTFGSESWLETDVLMYGSSFRPVRISLTRGAVLGLDGLARRALGNGTAMGRLKRGWRRHLAPAES